MHQRRAVARKRKNRKRDALSITVKKYIKYKLQVDLQRCQDENFKDSNLRNENK